MKRLMYLFMIKVSVMKGLNTFTSDLHCSGSACWLYRWLLFIYCSCFWQIFSFLPSLFPSSNNNFLFFFPEIGDKYIFLHLRFVAHKLFVCHRLNASKLLKRSTTIANYWWSRSAIQCAFTLYRFFFLFSWDIHKFIRILLISLQILVKLYFSNGIIDMLYK